MLERVLAGLAHAFKTTHEPGRPVCVALGPCECDGLPLGCVELDRPRGDREALGDVTGDQRIDIEEQLGAHAPLARGSPDERARHLFAQVQQQVIDEDADLAAGVPRRRGLCGLLRGPVLPGGRGPAACG